MHTAGPWRLSGFEAFVKAPSRVIMGADGFSIANVGERTPEENAANAHLIVAAPDLLEAVRIALKCMAWCRRHHKDAQTGEGFPVEMIFHAAIAKAEGKVPWLDEGRDKADSVEALNLNSRAWGTLAHPKNGDPILSITQLRQVSDADLKKRGNCGRKTIAEIHAAIREYDGLPSVPANGADGANSDTPEAE